MTDFINLTSIEGGGSIYINVVDIYGLVSVENEDKEEYPQIDCYTQIAVHKDGDQKEGAWPVKESVGEVTKLLGIHASDFLRVTFDPEGRDAMFRRDFVQAVAEIKSGRSHISGIILRNGRTFRLKERAAEIVASMRTQ